MEDRFASVSVTGPPAAAPLAPVLDVGDAAPFLSSEDRLTATMTTARTTTPAMNGR
jgi:hypothetical protein